MGIFMPANCKTKSINTMKTRNLLAAAVVSAFTVSMLVTSCGSGEQASQQVKTPLMGWSSWNAYMVNISDSIICHQADMLVSSGLKDAGYAQVDIDDGFFGPRDENGKMTAHPTRFPKGMRPVADYIHSLGMKAGIYSDAGDNTCGSQYNHDTTGVGAGLYGHDVQDADLYFNEWDFDFIKIDYCGGMHARLDEKARYSEIRRVVDSVANKHVSINVCRWAYPGTWVENVGDSWRTTGDVRPNWASVKDIIDRNLYMSAYARNGHYNDMDMLVIGYEGNRSGLGGKTADDITEDYLLPDEEDAHFGMWCIMSSPLLIGCKIEGIPERSLQLLKNEELIAVNQDPLGLQAHVVRHDGDTYVLAKDLKEKWGSVRAIALYNPTDSVLSVSVNPDELEFSGAVKVRDMLLHEDLGSMDSITMAVPAHGVKMLRVEGERAEPVLYEAEWGYMPQYTAIAKGPVCRPCEDASGRTVADGLGGEGNYLLWEDVHSIEGGKYSVSLQTYPSAEGASELSSIVMTVNGKDYKSSGAADGIATYNVKLRKGSNTVRLSSGEAMPAVDKITLEKL